MGSRPRSYKKGGTINSVFDIHEKEQLNQDILNIKQKCRDFQDENTRLKTHNQQLHKEIRNNERVIEEMLLTGPNAKRANLLQFQSQSIVLGMKRQVREYRMQVEALTEQITALKEDESYIKSQKYQKQNRQLRLNLQKVTKQLSTIEAINAKSNQAEKQQIQKLTKERDTLKQQVIQSAGLA